jgi:hypothetical protein
LCLLFLYMVFLFFFFYYFLFILILNQFFFFFFCMLFLTYFYFFVCFFIFPPNFFFINKIFFFFSGNGANNHQILIENLTNKKTILDKLLIRKEHDGLSIYLVILSKMLNEKVKDSERRVEVAEKRIISPLREMLEDVSSEKPLKDLPSNRQEYRKSKLIVINHILDVILSFGDELFKRHCNQFFKGWTDLLLSDAIEYNEIRTRIHELNLRAAKLFNIFN